VNVIEERFYKSFFRLGSSNSQRLHDHFSKLVGGHALYSELMQSA